MIYGQQLIQMLPKYLIELWWKGSFLNSLELDSFVQSALVFLSFSINKL